MQKERSSNRWLSAVATLTRNYPFYSGCGAIANHRVMKIVGPPTPAVVWANSPGGPIQVPLNDHVGRSVFFFGDLDPKVTWALKRLIAPGDVALDVGANFGLVTMLMAKMAGTEGAVHAFEPNPTVARVLADTLANARIGNVELHATALGRISGTMELHVPQGNLGAASLVRNRTNSYQVHSVPVTTLDEFIERKQLKRVGLMKLDVEGFEFEVLSGARRLLADIRPAAILFESNGEEPSGQVSPVMELLEEHGYSFISIPRCLVRMRTNIVDGQAKGSPPGHDLIAAPNGAAFSRICRLLRAN